MTISLDEGELRALLERAYRAGWMNVVEGCSSLSGDVKESDPWFILDKEASLSVILSDAFERGK